MAAMLLDALRRPLRPAELRRPFPGPGQMLLQVRSCAVCRTDLHVADDELPDPKLPPGRSRAPSLSQANEGLARLREGRLQGAPVLAPGPHPHDS